MPHEIGKGAFQGLMLLYKESKKLVAPVAELTIIESGEISSDLTGEPLTAIGNDTKAILFHNSRLDRTLSHYHGLLVDKRKIETVGHNCRVCHIIGEEYVYEIAAVDNRSLILLFVEPRELHIFEAVCTDIAFQRRCGIATPNKLQAIALITAKRLNNPYI